MCGVEVGLALPAKGNVALAARDAEQSGFHYVAAGDHVAFHSDVPSTVVWLATAAGATSRIGLAATVSILSLYPSVAIAKQLISLDHLSNGRLSVGVGVGGEYPKEFTACGVDVSERGPRTDEAIRVLQRLWKTAPATFVGRFASFDDISILPRPVQSRVPIWIAGRKSPAMRRAAQFGDVWMPYMYTPQQVSESLAQVRERAEGFQRDPEGIKGGMYLFVSIDEDRDFAEDQMLKFLGDRYNQSFEELSHYLVMGTPEECLSKLAEYCEAGVSTFILELACDFESRKKMQEILATVVLPELSGWDV